MSLSPEIIDQSTDETDPIDRTKSKLKEGSIMETNDNSSNDNDASEPRCELQNYENLQGSVDGVDQQNIGISNEINDGSPSGKAEGEAVHNEVNNEDSLASNSLVVSYKSTADEVTSSDDAPASDKHNNSEQPDAINKTDDLPRKIEDSSSECDTDKNAASPTSPEIALPPSTSAPSPNQTSPSELTSSPNNEICSSTAMETENTDGAMATCSNASSPSSDKAPIQSVYHVKWIKYKGNTVAIITQNENGPCPLLAIMNVLLLKNKIKLPGMIEMVTSGQLMEYLGDCIFENAPKDITEDAQLNYEQNMHDAMAVFHKLQTGLDVNVKFTGVNDFEYTSECIVFDLLNIPLYHGWLTDPESPEVVAAIGSCSYNQLVEKIISQKNSKKEELMTEALICEEFLERTAAQLTYHGLSELVTSVKEDEMCVFFRNNHFSTLYKYKNELFLLVTDQGFLTESNVVWETLCNVEGDGHFVDADFRTYRKPEPSTVPVVAPPIPVGTDQQIDQDYLVALSLQQEPPPADMAMSWPTSGQPVPHLSDHELALQLQEEENRRAAAAPAAQQNQRQPAQRTQSAPVGGATSQKKKDKDCIIL